MKALTIQIDNATLARLQRSAGRDGITVDAAILDGIRVWVEAEEEAAGKARGALHDVFTTLPTGLN
jgi:hypothetical protein